MSDERLHHIQLCPGEVGRYVLLPGDPGRVDKIARRLDAPRLMACNREYRTMTGALEGAAVSVMSTGIGGPSTAIGVEELFMLGADTFIRVGTCGGMQETVLPGDVVIASAAIRAEGTSREYMPLEFPAVADYETLRALGDAARALGHRHHVGVVQCKDSFYGQHAPERMPVARQLMDNWRAWIQGGCLASEMESAALFILASTLHARAASVHLCVANQERRRLGWNEDNVDDPEKAIDVAILALRRLIAADRALP